MSSIEAIGKRERITLLCRTIEGGGTVYFRQVALGLRAMGDELTGKAAKGWLHVLEDLLPCNQSALAGDVERVADLISFCKAETPQGRKMFTKMLELAAEISPADKAPAEILTNGLKVPSSVKEVYPLMYHYIDGSTLLNPSRATCLPSGSWKLPARPDGRYLSPSLFGTADEARTMLQLPKAGELDLALTKGRFRIRFATSDVADELRIPRGWRHGVENGENWLEVVAKDNPSRGMGEAPQLTTRLEVIGELVDTESGTVIRSVEELEQALGLR